MPDFMLAIGSAFWLGILTSISPCPLATNIAAISYVGRNLASPVNVFMGGVLYTAGRSFAYLAIGVILVSSLLSAPSISFFLQTYMNKVLGPVLILTGLILTGVISLNFFSGTGISARFQKRLEKMGMAGAILMGVVFALSFCPVSAALFFGSLIPLSLKHESNILLPSIYGIGTALPVFVFSFLIAFSAQLVGKVFNKLTQIELWVRRITGGIFIIVGIYFCLIYIFRVL